MRCLVVNVKGIDYGASKTVVKDLGNGYIIEDADIKKRS